MLPRRTDALALVEASVRAAFRGGARPAEIIAECSGAGLLAGTIEGARVTGSGRGAEEVATGATASDTTVRTAPFACEKGHGDRLQDANSGHKTPEKRPRVENMRAPVFGQVRTRPSMYRKLAVARKGLNLKSLL